MGSYICTNSQCSKLTSEGVTNKIDLKREKGGGYTCRSCGYYVKREYCGALKALEYDETTSVLTVFHQGIHKCTLKPEIQSTLSWAKQEMVNRDLCKTPKEWKIDLMGYYLAKGEVEKSSEVAEKLNDPQVFDKLCYMVKEGGCKQSSKESTVDAFKNIRTLKETTDKKDLFNIYKINCSDINGEPSFVFKTSRKALELALKMDPNVEDGKERSILTFEWVYIDGMHSCVIGFKTLTMWTYHPGMHRVMNLAIMDCEHENTEMLTLFLKLFNYALQDLTGDKTYKFNPYRIKCDENGANFNAIVNVFGKEYLERTVTCQWHFRQCANRQIAKVNRLERESFKNLVNAICYSNTVNDYNNVSNALEKICE